jgi:hypothetical protein
MERIGTALVWLLLSARAPGGEMGKLSFQNPDIVDGAEDSIIREIASGVIIPGRAHEDLWVHPNLVTIPGNPIQMELALRSTDRRGSDKHTVFSCFRTGDDFGTLYPIDDPVPSAWARIGLTPTDFDQSADGVPLLPEGEWKLLQEMPKYEDTVSNITNIFLEPTAYSQV